MPEKDVIQRLNKLYDQGRAARRPFEAEAWLNIAFFLGEQYVEWAADANMIRAIPRPESEKDLPRPTINKIMHYVYQAHAQTLQDKPSADVLPATNETMAQTDAEVNKAYVNYTMEPVNTNWDLQLSFATLWALLTPAGWLKWTWNPVLRRADIQPVGFFDVVVDPYAKQFGHARYVCHEQFMDPVLCEQLWPGAKFKPGEIENSDTTRVELLRGMGSAPIPRGITVRELWHKPDHANPRGLYAVWAGKHLLVEPQPLPYDHLREDGGRLPFTQLGCLPRPDSLYYKTPVSYLRPAQMVLNKFFAQAIQIQDAFAAPKWWIPIELQLEQLPNSSPRQILRGNSGNTGLKPEMIQPPSMPALGPMVQLFEEQMMHIVGQHEVSQAQVPGRVEAAKAIELLKSSDEGRYKALLDTIDQAISEGFYQVLRLAQQYETQEKMITVYSREGVPMIKRWDKKKVQPGIQIRVTRMSGLGRTRTQRSETLLSYWREGIIKDPDLMADLLEVPIPSFSNARANDMILARSENLEMADGIATTANSWDNHAIHIREHNEYRKTLEFREISADAKQKFEFHVDRHKKLQLMAARELAGLMAAQQGMPPPGTVPTAPGTPTAATGGDAAGQAGPEQGGPPSAVPDQGGEGSTPAAGEVA